MYRIPGREITKRYDAVEDMHYLLNCKGKEIVSRPGVVDKSRKYDPWDCIFDKKCNGITLKSGLYHYWARHARKKSNEHRYQCPKCSVTFFWRHQLKNHYFICNV